MHARHGPDDPGHVPAVGEEADGQVRRHHDAPVDAAVFAVATLGGSGVVPLLQKHLVRAPGDTGLHDPIHTDSGQSQDGGDAQGPVHIVLALPQDQDEQGDGRQQAEDHADGDAAGVVVFLSLHPLPDHAGNAVGRVQGVLFEILIFAPLHAREHEQQHRPGHHEQQHHEADHGRLELRQRQPPALLGPAQQQQGDGGEDAEEHAQGDARRALDFIGKEGVGLLHGHEGGALRIGVLRGGQGLRGLQAVLQQVIRADPEELG